MTVGHSFSTILLRCTKQLSQKLAAELNENGSSRQVDNATAGKDLVAAFAVGSIPANVLLGPDGRVIRLDLRGKTLNRTLETRLPTPTPEPANSRRVEL